MASGSEKDPGINPRSKMGVIFGYIGMLLGLLAVIGQASEIQALPMNVGAAIVLLHMVGGYVVGWLIQPLLARWFST